MLNNTKTLIIKSLFGQKLGKIIFLLEKNEFMVDISIPSDKEKIEKLLSGFFKNGIRDLGPIILDEPIKSDNPLFLQEINNQLAKRGYVPYIEK